MDAYGYADLESVFSVIEQISKDATFADLGFTSTYMFTKLGVNVKLGISTDLDRRLAGELSKAMKEFVRRSCQLEEPLALVEFI